MNWLRKLKLSTILSLLSAILIFSTVFAASGNSQWPSAGHDLSNTHYNSSESKIDVSNVASLTKAWSITTGGDISAIPAADSKTVYVPDWAGNLYAIDQKTGDIVWQHQISDYTGVSGDFVRATPALVGNMLIFGDQGGRFLAGADLIAVNKKDGSLIWVQKVEPYSAAVITQSAVVDVGGPFKYPVVYVGTSSVDEFYNTFGFRGSVLAVNANTGQPIWQTYTVPVGYNGGSVWGSTPAIDHSRGLLYIGTGNNYSMPSDVQDCITNATNPDEVKACISPDDHFDSVMALDLQSGAIKWATAALPYDAWTGSCLSGGTSCPQPAGPDYDFGQGPMLFTVKGSDGMPRDLVGDGQKSGQFWAFDPDTGAVVWETQVGPGSSLGGLEWGSSTDGNHIYVAEANNNRTPWTLLDGTTVTSGFWASLDAASGQILWETPDPTTPYKTGDTGPVSGANGVVYACSMDAQGHMFAMDGATGSILWSFASGGSCNAGAAISNGMVFWGSGYSQFGGALGTPNNKFYAFQLP
jgi:polyvinyl alcohol dehydrogenase (cytochrome)